MAQVPKEFDPLARLITGMITDPTFSPDYMPLIERLADPKYEPKDLLSDIKKEGPHKIAKLRDALLVLLAIMHRYRECEGGLPLPEKSLLTEDVYSSPLPLVSSGIERFFGSRRARDWLEYAANAARSQADKSVIFRALLYTHHPRDRCLEVKDTPRVYGVVTFSVKAQGSGSVHVRIPSIQVFVPPKGYSNSVPPWFRCRVSDHCDGLCKSLAEEYKAREGEPTTAEQDDIEGEPGTPPAFAFFPGEGREKITDDETLEVDGVGYPSIKWASVIAMGPWIGYEPRLDKVEKNGDIVFIKAVKRLVTSLYAKIPWPNVKSELERADKCARESFGTEVATLDEEDTVEMGPGCIH